VQKKGDSPARGEFPTALAAAVKCGRQVSPASLTAWQRGFARRSAAGHDDNPYPRRCVRVVSAVAGGGGLQRWMQSLEDDAFMMRVVRVPQWAMGQSCASRQAGGGERIGQRARKLVCDCRGECRFRSRRSDELAKGFDEQGSSIWKTEVADRCCHDKEAESYGWRLANRGKRPMGYLYRFVGVTLGGVRLQRRRAHGLAGGAHHGVTRGFIRRPRCGRVVGLGGMARALTQNAVVGG
jgi:hypothetical protein